jgi:thiol-disulfide isomerase/thioredoxin
MQQIDRRTALAQIAALATVGGTALASGRALAGEGMAPKPAADFTLPIHKGGGKAVTLSKLRGQVVMVNFWATWCAPCRQEFPLLDQMYKKYQPMGFQLLAVNVEDDKADPDTFLKQVPVSFPVLRDLKNEVSRRYNVQAMPTTVLVDRKGQLRWLHRGYKPGDENGYLDQMRALLRER